MKNKKWLACLIVVLLSSGAQAQIFEKIKFGFGGTLAFPTAKGPWRGILTYVEPSYALTGSLTVSLHAEWGYIKVGLPDGRDYRGTFRSIYTANAKYYLSATKLRPYVGAGFSFYHFNAVRLEAHSIVFGSLSPGEAITEPETRFGFCPRVGADLRQFTIFVDYNFLPSTGLIDPTSNARIKNSYFGVHLGLHLNLKKPGARRT